MVRVQSRNGKSDSSSPHPRGDGPRFNLCGWHYRVFSPPAWGWSGGDGALCWHYWVLPTRVGMVRCQARRMRRRRSSPHPRGDGPKISDGKTQMELFSPPAWGWSELDKTLDGRLVVLPTRVGMVRPLAGSVREECRSPHPRGDGPQPDPVHNSGHWFSPPAWGWSAEVPSAPPPRQVLPTRVGMVRSSLTARPAGCCSPHPRGDGPPSPPNGCSATSFSPPAWGWSDSRSRKGPAQDVLPTRVGMVRHKRTWPA